MLSKITHPNTTRLEIQLDRFRRRVKPRQDLAELLYPRLLLLHDPFLLAGYPDIITGLIIDTV